MLSTTSMSSPPSSPGVRQDWFMMTGDLIINLASEKAGEPRIKPTKHSPVSSPTVKVDQHPFDKQHLQPSQQQLTQQLQQQQQQQQPVDSLTSDEDHHNHQTQQQQQQQQHDDDCDYRHHLHNDDSESPRMDLNNKNSTLTRSAASNASSGVADLDDDDPITSSSVSPEPPTTRSQNRRRHKSKSSRKSHHINNNEDDFYEDEDGYEDDIDSRHHPTYENVQELKRRIADGGHSTICEESDVDEHEESRSFDFTDSKNILSNHCHHSQQQQQQQQNRSIEKLALDLYHLNGYHKSEVAQHLGKNNEHSRAIAAAYLRHFDFTAMKLDEALREFFTRFFLTGETFERERVLIYFSKRFHECNPHANFLSTDSIHTLVCALMLLNTDLHEDRILRKMSCVDFITNLSGLNEGNTDYAPELLKYLYYSVKSRPLGWNDEFDDHSEMGETANNDALARKARTGSMFSKMTTISRSIPLAGPVSATLSRKFPSNRTIDARSVSSATIPFIQLPNPAVAIEYKRGYIRRKCCRDPDGKRTPKGKRSWRLFFATVRDLVLYLHREESHRPTGMEQFENSIRIHHSIAMAADDYHKKQFVFRLVTADLAEYLFETSDSRELQSWIDVINTTAASLSAPTLPPPVGSSPVKLVNPRKRPVLPVSHTKLTTTDQLRDHESKLLSLQKDLELVLEESSNKKLSSSARKLLAEKENYLQHEVARYRVYISCLKRKSNEQLASSTSNINTSASTNIADIMTNDAIVDTAVPSSSSQVFNSTTLSSTNSCQRSDI